MRKFLGLTLGATVLMMGYVEGMNDPEHGLPESQTIVSTSEQPKSLETSLASSSGKGLDGRHDIAPVTDESEKEAGRLSSVSSDDLLQTQSAAQDSPKFTSASPSPERPIEEVELPEETSDDPVTPKGIVLFDCAYATAVVLNNTPYTGVLDTLRDSAQEDTKYVDALADALTDWAETAPIQAALQDDTLSLLFRAVRLCLQQWEHRSRQALRATLEKNDYAHVASVYKRCARKLIERLHDLAGGSLQPNVTAAGKLIADLHAWTNWNIDALQEREELLQQLDAAAGMLEDKGSGG